MLLNGVIPEPPAIKTISSLESSKFNDSPKGPFNLRYSPTLSLSCIMVVILPNFLTVISIYSFKGEEENVNGLSSSLVSSKGRYNNIYCPGIKSIFFFSKRKVLTSYVSLIILIIFNFSSKLIFWPLIYQICLCSNACNFLIPCIFHYLFLLED